MVVGSVEDSLQLYVPRLSLGDVSVSLFKGDNLVSLLDGHSDMLGRLGSLTDHVVHRDLSASEIVRVGGLPSGDTLRQSYEVGSVPASELVGFETLYDMFDKLTFGHDKSRDLVWHFCADEMPQGGVQSFSLPVTELVDGDLRDKVTGNDDEVVRLSQPFSLFVRDLSSMGEVVSPSRLVYFGPFVQSLASKRQASRYALIRSMIDGSYPFDKYNRSRWLGEIRSAD